MRLLRPLLGMLLIAGMAGPAQAELVDGTVAAIDFKIISRSTLVAYRAAFDPAQPPAVALQDLIDDRLLAGEARRYGRQLEPGALEAGLKAHPTPPDLDEGTWRQVVRDRLMARQFLEFRFGEFVPIGREELRGYYEAHRDRFAQPFEAVEEQIRQLLLPAARARREEAYKAELRARQNVVVNPSLLPPD